jgi:ABC-type sugar transport system substrate-binding protein
MCLHGAAQGSCGAHERPLPYLARDKDNLSEGNTMAHHTLKISTPLSTLRTVLFGLISSGLVSASASVALAAEKLSCLPVQHMTETSAVAPANKKIGVSVAYLKVPFYANFKTGLEDGAKQFGFTYDLVDGNSGDVATELANLQNFIAQKKDLILLTPSGQGIIPGIKLVNDASIPIIEVNNKAGFGSGDVNVLTYSGADDVEFGRLQGKLSAGRRLR